MTGYFRQFCVFTIVLITFTERSLYSQVVSDFSVDVDGWNTFGDFGGAGPGTPIYQSSGGNPGGCIKQTDATTGVWYWYGPSKFRGDLSDYYDCNLKFDLKQNQVVFPVSEYDVMIFNNGSDTMVFNIDDPDQMNIWESFIVPLKVGVGWKYGSSIGGGAPVITAAQLAAILGDVKRIRIRAEYTGLGYETDYLDNVILTCEGVLLPVDLNMFRVSEHDFHTAKLEWSTLTEFNNAGFQIEKSLNGVDFDSIGFVQGNGTSSVSHFYHLYDNNFFATSYYRLKQLDITGKSGYSNIISLESNLQTHTIIQLYPNPASELITLSCVGNDPIISYTIKDISGKSKMKQSLQSNTGTYETSIPIQFLENGIYIFVCNTMSGTISQKFEVIK